MKRDKLTIAHMAEAHDALNVIYRYKGIKLDSVDFTTIFKTQPTKAQLKHLEAATSGKTFIQTLIMYPEIWAKEWGIELTAEYQKFLKKIRSKQK